MLCGASVRARLWSVCVVRGEEDTYLGDAPGAVDAPHVLNVSPALPVLSVVPTLDSHDSEV